MATIHKINKLPEGTKLERPKLSPREGKKLAIFNESLKGFTNRLLSVRDKKEKIDRALSHINEFREYSKKYPWDWTSDDFEDHCAHLSRDLGNGSSTQRMKQVDIKQYTEYLKNSKYSTVIEKEFGIILKSICTEDNMFVHKVENDNATQRRNFKRDELTKFFDNLDAHIKICENLHSKGLLPAQRDKALYALKTFYGVRTNEERLLDIDDFGPNPDHPEFGNFGRLEVWHGKATKGSHPKHRTVWTTEIKAAKFMEWYVTEIRPQFIGRKTKDKDIKALFFNERGGRISNRSIQGNLKNYLIAFGMYEEGLVPHSMRRSFITMAQEDGRTSPNLVRKQAGHVSLSQTQAYTDLDDPFYRKALNDTIDRNESRRQKRGTDEE